MVPVPTLLDPAGLLSRAKRRDGSRPLITYYDLDAGGRTELSVAGDLALSSLVSCAGD